MNSAINFLAQHWKWICAASAAATHLGHLTWRALPGWYAFLKAEGGVWTILKTVWSGGPGAKP